jgi:flagellar basal body P-ring formation protein FlgA
MKMKLQFPVLLCLFSLFSQSLFAQTIAAAQTIRSKAIIAETDLIVLAKIINGALTSADQVIGMEARTTLYPGRPIRPGDIGPPALVSRNEIVVITYVKGSLSISAEGRALGRAGLGERVRVMNLASRSTIFGIVTSAGKIRIAP